MALLFMSDGQIAIGQICIKKSKKNILTLKLIKWKGYFGLQNARNWLEILWEHYKASFTLKTRCKGDIVEGEVVVKLHGDQPTVYDYISMLWRNQDAY